ncbi:putative effector protein [Erysiphe necator]|uniref:Putative effector protein n=1 Tax=Uncinula necator TaxID=52586 RepID=A0A0B1NWC3_UNCNE|nr:putative effector protein [Erysiphe necator]
MEVNTVVDAADGPNLDSFEEEDPLRSKSPQKAALISPKPTHTQSDRNQRNVTSLMSAIKGLLDLTNDYLQNLETQYPGIGSDFLALLSDGASHAMPSTNPTWAKIAASQDPANVSFKRRNIKSSPPQGQCKEDRRIMIRLAPDHEARKSGTFELRQTIQKLVTDSSLISDVWNVPSGAAKLASMPVKAAIILQAKKVIEERFGNATVERQETWTTFVIGPIQKQIRCLDGFRDPMDGLLQDELAAVQESVQIRYMNWTRRSQNDEPTGYVRICVREEISSEASGLR